METIQTFPTPETEIVSIKDQFEQLANSDLAKFSLSSDRSSLTFDLTTGPQGADYTIQLIEVIHLVFSRTPGDEEPYFVGEVAVTSLIDGGEKLLPALLYGFREKSGKTASFPSVPLYHVRLEGGISFEVICKHIQILKICH